MGNTVKTDVLIIGTGFGGLCMSAKLKASGKEDFIILEKADGVGGTWRENRYPGAECDIASVLYSYSFYPNPTWDFKWAKQKQILDYLNRFTDDMNIRKHIRFGQHVSGAQFDEGAGRWSVKTADGTIYSARFLVTALGQLHHAKTPGFKGQDIFKGPQFHTAEWPEGVDLRGKNVAIIGNAASAIQTIPEIAKIAKTLTIYQRSANWIIPKRDRPYSRFEKGVAKLVPGLSKLYRGFWFGVGEFLMYPMIRGRKRRSWLGRAMCRSEMKKFIKDPDMQAALTPDYPIGAKRILLSETYYPALARENVGLVNVPIKALTSEGIHAGDDIKRPHDVIVYATGFYTHPFYKDLPILGENGVELGEHWDGGAFAYHGVMTSGFPNLFMLYGPNTNSGHTSIVFKLENQVNYILQLLERAEGKTIRVNKDAEIRYNEEMQTRLADTSWAKIDKSWYKTGEKIDLNWPGSGIEYKRRMKTPINQDFHTSPE